MKTAKILSFTTLIAMAMGAGSVSLAEEVKDSSTGTEIVSVEGSDLRNEDALRVAVGDFDDVEFLLSAEEMEAIADNVYISFNGVSAKGGEGSGSSMFSGDASGQVEATQSASTSFSGALTLASKTNTSDAVTTGVGTVAMSMSSDNSTEQYATDAGKSYYEQVSTSNSGSAVTTYSTTSFLGNSNSVGDGNGGYGTSAIDSGIVPFAAASRTWQGGNDDNNWSNGSNWKSNGWTAGDNATFDGTGSENNIVTVDQAITAAKITVTGNTEYTFEYASGASLEATGNVTIGSGSGDNSSLTITGGTTNFNGQYTYIGYGGTGSLTITGGETTFKNTASSGTGYTYVGSSSASGDGTITIGSVGGDDDDLTVTFGDYVRIGHNGATGTIIINSGTTTFKNKVYLGSSSNSTGAITINGGATTFESEVYIGDASSAIGYVTINSGATTFKKEVYVGYSSSTGTLTITDGANEFDDYVYIGGATSSNSGTGYVVISGGENMFKGEVDVGHNGSGSLTITEGTNTFTGQVYVGYRSSTTGTITIEGGTNTFEGNISIGRSGGGTGSMTISGGETTIKGTTTIATNNSSLSVSGGTVYLETKIGTSAYGTVAISNNANIVLSGALLDSIEKLANGSSTNAVAVIMANTISFGEITLTTNTDLDSLVNQYVSAEGYQLTWSYHDNTLYIVSAAIAPIPEPSMFGLFLGLGAIGLVATRRRRRKA